MITMANVYSVLPVTPCLINCCFKDKLLLSGLQICLRPHGCRPQCYHPSEDDLTNSDCGRSQGWSDGCSLGVSFLIPLLDAPLDKALRAGFVRPVEAEVPDPTSHTKGCRLWGSWMG